MQNYFPDDICRNYYGIKSISEGVYIYLWVHLIFVAVTYQKSFRRGQPKRLDVTI